MLTDKSGNVICYLKAPDSIDLARHIDERVRVRGRSKWLPNQTRIVEVRDVGLPAAPNQTPPAAKGADAPARPDRADAPRRGQPVRRAAYQTLAAPPEELPATPAPSA